MASNPRIAPSLPPMSPTAQNAHSLDAFGVPAVEYMIGRPVPQPILGGIAALLGGWTAAPRSTHPGLPHPSRAVTGSGTGSYATGEFSIGNIEGAHEYGSGGGYPHSDSWPGWPTDGGWETPFFSDPSPQHGSQLSKRISVTWSCIDLISRLVSTMPTNLVRDSIPQPPVPWMDCPEPLLYSSSIDAYKALINSLLVRGEGFVLPSAYYSDGYPARWFILNPDMLIEDPQADGTTHYWLEAADGDPNHRILLDNEELLHIRYQVMAGQSRGVGPLESAWRNIASAESMSDYAAQMSGRGGVPNAVLQSETSLTDEQTAKLKGSWRRMIASNGGEPVVLTKGLTYQALSFNARELALLDSRIFDEQRIAAAFGVPGYLVGLPAADSMTYSSANMAFDYFWRSTLRPLSRNISLAFSLKMLPAKTYLQFDADELTRPGQVERATAYQMLVGSKIITPDEVRIEEGLAPLGEADRAKAFPAPPPQLAAPQPGQTTQTEQTPAQEA